MNKYNYKINDLNLLWLAFFIFNLFILIFFSSIASAQIYKGPPQSSTSLKLVLTADEKAWLAEHSTITLGSGIYPPLNFIDEQGKSVGIGPDLLTLVAKRLGININLISANWIDILALRRGQKLDGIGMLVKTSDRLKHFDFAGPYIQSEYAILVHKGEQGINSLQDLENKKVGGVVGAYAQNFLRKTYPEIDLILYDSYEELMNGLVNREVDAVVENAPSLIYFIGKSLITGLKIVGYPESMAHNLYAGIRKDWPQFTTILNKAFSSISQREYQRIVNKWTEIYPSTDKMKQLPLTLKQKAWLAEQHKVRVRVVNYPPYMMVRPGKAPEGIAIDYLKLIAQRTGIKFIYEITDQPFYEFLENMKQKKFFDLSALVVNQSDRQEYMLFSHDYIESTPVLFARNDTAFVGRIQGFSGKSVAVEKGGNVHRSLAIKYPKIILALYDSAELALAALANGSVDAYVGSLSNSAYIIQMHGYSNIKVIAPSTMGSQYFAMGSRKDWPELTSLINLALTSISENEKMAIQKKYVALKYEVQGYDSKQVLTWIGVIICSALLIVLFFILWNRSLRNLVDHRTEELQQEVLVRREANKALLKSQKEALKTQKIASLGSWEWDTQTGEITWSRELYNIFDLPMNTTLTYTIIMRLIHPDDQQTVRENEAKWLNAQDGSPYEFRVVRSDGSVRHVHSMVEVVCDDKGVALRLFGTMQDVSVRKESERVLLHYQKRLKSLVQQLTLVEDQERRHIAANLHDNVGQSLALTRLQLATVLKRLPDDNKAVDLVKSSSQLLLTAIQETRNLIFELSSPSLNELGLAAAITEWKMKYCVQSYDLDVEVIDQLKTSIDNLDLRGFLFRNTRELLVNVIKHAKASIAVVILEEKLGSYVITVKDNGIGFIVGNETGNVSNNGHFGLFSIQERLTDLGGELLINSIPNKGCTVVMKLPITKWVV